MKVHNYRDYEKEYEVFGSRLKEVRKEKYKTQADFAEDIEKTLESVRNWEQGRALPEMGTLFKIADLLECDIDYLTGRIDRKTHDIQFIHEMTGLSEGSIQKLCDYKNAEDRRSSWSTNISSILEHDDFPKLMSHVSDFLGAAQFEGIQDGLKDKTGMSQEIDNQAAQLFYISHILTDILDDIAVEHRNKGLNRTKNRKEVK